MCMIDDGDRPRVHSSRMVKARKEHKCDECRRTIGKGEMYQYVFIVCDYPEDYHTCQHCITAAQWLVETCDGYLLGQVREDLIEHAVEYDLVPLAVYAAWMKQKWCAEDGMLMPIPEKLPLLELH